MSDRLPCESGRPGWEQVSRAAPADLLRAQAACRRCPLFLDGACADRLRVTLAHGDRPSDVLWAGKFYGKRGFEIAPETILNARYTFTAAEPTADLAARRQAWDVSAGAVQRRAGAA